MIRAVAKGAGLFAFGRAPGGAHAYRALTRGRLGTAASHVDKLARVWPGYVRVWRAHGVALEGAQIWAHDAGATPFMPIAAYLLTGRGAVTTNAHDRFLDRYLAYARAGALDAAWPDGAIPDERRRAIEGLRWIDRTDDALARIATQIHDAPTTIATHAIDLCHSGGALEHETPAALDAFLRELRRALKPGAVASHVYDHRDHLHHADNRLPFLAHLAWPELAYRALFAHPLGFHARLSPTEVAARFEAAGFTRLAVRRLIYDAETGERRWVDRDDDAHAGRPGVPRALLARRFRAISDADLRTAAAHYLYRA
ncbi:MAG TPA: class I SAM-dependent methyltransferase [Kofleriaceae bacterium]|nr:class I SAM-dependent methyltransferase [Kofleriaceae bacterium]